MKALSAAELLTVWERGMSLAAPQRALLLLSAAHPKSTLDQLAQLSVGQRDAQLLTLREQILGSQIVSLATCPQCGNTLELTFEVADIRLSDHVESTANLSLQLDGYEVEYRLPNSEDLAEISKLANVSTATQLLQQRCLCSVHYRDEKISPEQIPPEVNQAMLAQMAQADPQADIQLDLSCSDCGHQWQAAFDILTFFWQELTVWAQRILQEVHQLASAYSWSEADILAMSPQRRQIYLEMSRP
ncbi:MAG: phage baseplate protein [Cyanobacteria bacterium J06607_13]